MKRPGGFDPVPDKPVARATPPKAKVQAGRGSTSSKPVKVSTANRQQRKVERQEVRRFTRRSRHRRTFWLGLTASLAVLGVLLAVAIYSPVMSLRTIRIEGATSVPADEIKTTLEGQLGTPLALLDYDRIKGELEKYPKIRSFVTEVVPPSTLVVKITERSAIAQVQSSTGFLVIDPAGVVISNSPKRISGLPILRVDFSDPNSPAFRSAIEVLIALPDSIRSQVSEITATSKDDVTLALVSANQSVIWGSAERSALKARVLEELMNVQGQKSGLEFDVSAPLSPVVKQG